jgi:hypothetical protein
MLNYVYVMMGEDLGYESMALEERMDVQNSKYIYKYIFQSVYRA